MRRLLFVCALIVGVTTLSCSESEEDPTAPGNLLSGTYVGTATWGFAGFSGWIHITIDCDCAGFTGTVDVEGWGHRNIVEGTFDGKVAHWVTVTDDGRREPAWEATLDGDRLSGAQGCCDMVTGFEAYRQ